MTIEQTVRQLVEALELHGKQYPHMVKGYCVDAIAAGRTALAQMAAPVAAAPGYVLVPREPTEAMLAAYEEANRVYWERVPHLRARVPGCTVTCYQAMLDAAPAAQAAKPEPAQRTELQRIHEVIMNVGANWPDDERDPYTLRHVRWMARELKKLLGRPAYPPFSDPDEGPPQAMPTQPPTEREASDGR